MAARTDRSTRAEPRGCPFCLTQDLHTIAGFADTLAAYRCQRCAEVFYTIDLQAAAHGPRVTDLLQRPPRRPEQGQPLRARRPPLAFRSLARVLPTATPGRPRPHPTLPRPGQPLHQWAAQR